jgi:hypothetical protein
MNNLCPYRCAAPIRFKHQLTCMPGMPNQPFIDKIPVQTRVQQLDDAQSTVHSLQRGARLSPTTLALSMLQALTRPLLAWMNHPCSPNLGKCQRASPDCIGGANWALAAPLLLSEDRTPMTVPMPTRAAPSSCCFIG